MTYNFTDDPSPDLPTLIDAAGDVVLQDGSPQGDLITDAFSGRTVTVSIVPPSGWTLDDVTWTSGGTGTFPIPGVGEVDSYDFSYTVSQEGNSKSNTGNFKIKKTQGTG
jgi:hypothetical protein